MGRKRKSVGEKPKKLKKVNCTIAPRVHGGKVTYVYTLMEDLIDRPHDHLSDAKIGIAWRYGWNTDADGVRKLVQVVKASDLTREIAEYDFVILLGHEAWQLLSADQQRGVMDHALCRMQVSQDTSGEVRTDERGRTVYRLRKPDIVEFSDVIKRHGFYISELEAIAEAARFCSERPLLSEDDPSPRKHGNGKKKGKAAAQEAATSGPFPVVSHDVEPDQAGYDEPAVEVELEADQATPKKRGRPRKGAA